MEPGTSVLRLVEGIIREGGLKAHCVGLCSGEGVPQHGLSLQERRKATLGFGMSGPRWLLHLRGLQPSMIIAPQAKILTSSALFRRAP